MQTSIQKIYEEADKKREKILSEFSEVAVFAPPSYNEINKELYEILERETHSKKVIIK